MKSSRIPFLLLFITLMVGFISGFLVNGMLTRQRIDNMRTLFQDEGRFEARVLKDLDIPAEKEELVKPILKAHFQKVQGLHKEFRSSMQANFQELQEELSPILSEEELERLRKKMRRKRPPHHRHPHAPHGPRE